jgi:murein DD-endopeptidase MepM/ murein hydrolase activator NlpD
MVEFKDQNKFIAWIKKYGIYCMAGLLVFAIGIACIFTGQLRSTEQTTWKVKDPLIIETGISAVTFGLPMNNATIIKEFSSSGLYENVTLGVWGYHDGMDLISNDLAVLAVADGKVSEVYSNFEDGNVIVITHSNNFKSRYSSLDVNAITVQVGDNVKRGDRIGTAGDSSNYEREDGNHLHFELFLNDESIDPASYLEFEAK